MINTKTKILFFGTPEFAAKGLHSLIESSDYQVSAVITQPDRPAGRGHKLGSSPVKLLAKAREIPILQPNKIKRELADFIHQVQLLGPFDIGVVIAFGQILPIEVLNIPRLGCINVHASLLPRWRGAAPIQRCIMAGDQETGVQLMQMEAGLDTGPIFATSKTIIYQQDTARTLHDRLAVLGADLLREKLKQIVNGNLKAVPQVSEGETYAAKILKQEAEIDWTNSSQQIERKVRGLFPSPGAYSYWGNKRLKILSADSIPYPDRSLPPGSILNVSTELLTIQCGEGALSVTEVQIEGKKPSGVDEFLRGNATPCSMNLKRPLSDSIEEKQ